MYCLLIIVFCIAFVCYICFSFLAGHFEFWFLVQHKLINTDLNVFYGSVSMHKDEFQSIFSKPHVIEEMFSLAKKFQTLYLTEEEVALVRGIALTFTGWYRQTQYVWCFRSACQGYT